MIKSNRRALSKRQRIQNFVVEYQIAMQNGAAPAIGSGEHCAPSVPLPCCSCGRVCTYWVLCLPFPLLPMHIVALLAVSLFRMLFNCSHLASVLLLTEPPAWPCPRCFSGCKQAQGRHSHSPRALQDAQRPSRGRLASSTAAPPSLQTAAAGAPQRQQRVAAPTVRHTMNTERITRRQASLRVSSTHVELHVVRAQGHEQAGGCRRELSTWQIQHARRS